MYIAYATIAQYLYKSRRRNNYLKRVVKTSAKTKIRLIVLGDFMRFGVRKITWSSSELLFLLYNIVDVLSFFFFFVAKDFYEVIVL